MAAHYFVRVFHRNIHILCASHLLGQTFLAKNKQTAFYLFVFAIQANGNQTMLKPQHK